MKQKCGQINGDIRTILLNMNANIKLFKQQRKGDSVCHDFAVGLEEQLTFVWESIEQCSKLAEVKNNEDETACPKSGICPHNPYRV